MRLSFLFILIALTLVQCHSTKLYIVRHAEKSTSPPKDPDLTEEGRLRAQSLAGNLKKSKIQSIYTTETRRTMQTAEPLSLQESITIRHYKNDTLLKFLFRVLDAEQNALIVGHSNTVLPMLTELGLKPTIKEIPDNDYDNLFIVTLKSKDGLGGYNLKLKQTTYGKKSPATSDTSTTAMNPK